MPKLSREKRGFVYINFLRKEAERQCCDVEDLIETQEIKSREVKNLPKSTAPFRRRTPLDVIRRRFTSYPEQFI